MKLARSIMLLALVCLIVPSALSAQEICDIGVYFDPVGTVRTADPKCGQSVTLYVWGSACTGFMAGAEYAVDYGPNLTWIADFGLPPVSVGFSDVNAGGISLGYGFSPRPGQAFLLHLVFAQWNCTGAGCPPWNVDGPVVVANPTLGNPTPITQKFNFPFPDPPVPANGLRSQTCQFVEIDYDVGKCPNTERQKLWQKTAPNGGTVCVAILGSSSLDVTTIDTSTLTLNGLVPLPPPPPSSDDDDDGPTTPGGFVYADVAVGTDTRECDCAPPSHGGDDDDDSGSNGGADGYLDLQMYFYRADVAQSFGPSAPPAGDVIDAVVAGSFNDGLPFTGSDCIEVLGARHRDDDDDDADGDDFHGDGDSEDDVATLGFPSPNPFNPVTRISYSVPSTQNIQIAIYDVAGRLVEQLVNDVKSAGEYVVEWDAAELPSGVYFYRMKSGDRTFVRRAILLK